MKLLLDPDQHLFLMTLDKYPEGLMLRGPQESKWLFDNKLIYRDNSRGRVLITPLGKQVLEDQKVFSMTGFCLLKYVSVKGDKIEWLWNSRDGDAPEALPGRDGTPMFVANARFAPVLIDYVPPIGSRVIADHNEDSAKRGMRMLCDALGPMSATETKTLLTAVMGSPRVVEVDAELHRLFHRVSVELKGDKS